MTKKSTLGRLVGHQLLKRLRDMTPDLFSSILACPQSYKILAVHYDSKHPKETIQPEESFTG